MSANYVNYFLRVIELVWKSKRQPRFMNYYWKRWSQLIAGLALPLMVLSARGDIVSDLIAHWKFDESSGVIASDSSGRNNHASLINFPWDDSMWVAGRIGGALQFNIPDDGDDDQVVTDFPVVLDNQDSFTFAFWARRLPGANPFNPRFITPVSDQHWVLWTPGTGVGFYVPSPTPDPPEGAWRHYVVLYDRAASLYSVYVDGALVVNNVNAARPEAGETQWVIGHKELLEDHRDPWRGFLDDLRMYNRVLTESDVQELYAVAAAVAPGIVIQPQPISRFVGDTVVLSVVAEGTAPLQYQWSKGDVVVAGATNAALVITDAQVTDSGLYSVSISNSVGSIQSSTAQVEITDPPLDITTGLVLHYAFDETSGYAVTDSSGKGNHGTLYYSTGDGSEWVPGRIGGALLMNPPDGGNDDYVITDNLLTLENQDQFTFSFWVKLAPGSGVNPRIITPTTGHWVLWTPGTGVGFYTPAASPEPLIDVWRHFAVVYDRATGVYQLFVDGQRTGLEVEGRTRTEPDESYWVVGHAENVDSVADAFAGAIDDLRVYNRKLTGKDIAALHALAPATPPQIASSPKDLIAPEGINVTLSVVADGSELSYQWKKGGADLLGATSATLVIPSVTAADSGNYVAVVTNSLGQAESTPASVTVLPTLDLAGAPTVSSADYNTDFTAPKAFDGLRLSNGPNTSRWASPSDALPHWFYVDLGEDMTIQHVLLDWEAAYGTDYTLRGRTEAEGPTDIATDWTELALVSGYAQASHGIDGADVVFDFVNGAVVLQGNTAEEPFTTIISSAPKVRYLMLDGQSSALGLFSVWELQVHAEGANQPVALSISSGPAGVTISWPTTATGFTLEEAGSLSSSTWTAVEGVVNNSVTVSPGEARYYRLHN